MPLKRRCRRPWATSANLLRDCVLMWLAWACLAGPGRPKGWRFLRSASRLKFARQDVELAGAIRGSYLVVKGVLSGGQGNSGEGR